MTRLRFYTAMTLLAIGIGCSDHPTAPTAQLATPSTPAIAFVADDGPPHDLAVSVESKLRLGQIAYVCSTQPREYCNGGACVSEVDYYVQADRCPAVRIR